MSVDYFVENLLVLYPEPKNIIIKILMRFITFPHKYMYDAETLLRILTKIGFEAEERKVRIVLLRILGILRMNRKH